jgi:Tol biopolymer transport system component
MQGRWTRQARLRDQRLLPLRHRGAPALSPDGSKVAFSLRRYELEAGKSWSEIWLMKADGSG